jgi:hypothetical protein
MKSFVFIFRQTGQQLTQDQMTHRAAEVRDWAIHLRSEGHTMAPHLLGEQHYIAAPEGVDGRAAAAGSGDSIIAILLIDFPSFDDAKKAAESHPSRRYGVSIEVREATSPAFTPPAQ